MNVWSAKLLDLIAPVACCGCGRGIDEISYDAALGPWLCQPCARRVSVAPFEAVPVAFGSRCPPCVAALPYEGVTRKALLAYKEHRAWGLAPFLSRALVIGCRAATSQRWWPLQKTRAGPAVVLVPVPASREAQRRRGGDHVLRVARMAAAELRLSGWTVAVWRALRVRGRPVDSVGLSAAARQRNRAGSFALRRHRIVSGWRRTGEQNGNASVVLVDDVMASGATLSEAASVLQDGDVTVMGSVVITAPR